MRSRISHPKWYGMGAVGLALGAAAAGFGPAVRARVCTAASRAGLDVSVGGVRPAWFGVDLRDVTVELRGTQRVRARLGDVRVGLTLALRPARVDVRDAALTLQGSIADLRRDFDRWRGGRTERSRRGGRTLAISGDRVALHWAGSSVGDGADLEGVGFVRDDAGLHLVIKSGSLRRAAAELAIADAAVDVMPDGTVCAAHVASATAQWRREGSHQALPDAPQSHDADSDAPLVSLPQVQAIREKAGFLARTLASRLPPDARVGIDELTWKLSEGGATRDLTLGPGPFSLSRADGRFELRFSADAHGSGPSLAVRAVIPVDAGDVTATLDGGPVSLSSLGLHEGAGGLVDVARTTVAGRAQVALSSDGATLTFDVEGSARGLSVSNARLAPEVVRGVDLQLVARGALDERLGEAQLRLDDASASLGVLHVEASGAIEQQPDHVSASVRFELPSTSCQALLDSVPTALLPVLQDTHMAGTFGARGHFSFDTRSLDDLDLAYDVQDQCHITQVPPELARERFEQPFQHRIYMPDGSLGEQTTGPGSDNWTPIEEISPYMPIAVMTTEDGAFLHHQGFNRAAIRASIVANLKARRFVRGASTITMQLAKNLFLGREKTLSRKLEEVVLTDYLEASFTKDHLMELYLNVIEFGPAVYGVTAAAEYYFGRTPAELNLAECLFLSSLLPSPLRYGAMREQGDHPPESWMRLLHSLMAVAHKRGLVDDAELAEGLSESIDFWHGGQRPPPRPPVHARSPLEGPAGDSDADAPSLLDAPPQRDEE